jgi:exopolysaccharide production protein ExoY
MEFIHAERISRHTSVTPRPFACTCSFSRPIGGGAKRAIDVVLACCAILVFSPLLLGCALLVRATSPGPVLFRHQRIGFRGRPFCCLKFRTMVVDAGKRLEEHLRNDPQAAAEWRTSHKLRCDPRVTWVGLLLRKTSLDELPQLVNVLRGDMSLVGPRPIIETEIEKYADKFTSYARCRPGITGLWQINGRSRTTYAERVAYDVRYGENWSLLMDLKILVRTIFHLLGREGAY